MPPGLKFINSHCLIHGILCEPAIVSMTQARINYRNRSSERLQFMRVLTPFENDALYRINKAVGYALCQENVVNKLKDRRTRSFEIMQGNPAFVADDLVQWRSHNDELFGDV